MTPSLTAQINTPVATTTPTPAPTPALTPALTPAPAPTPATETAPAPTPAPSPTPAFASPPDQIVANNSTQGFSASTIHASSSEKPFSHRCENVKRRRPLPFSRVDRFCRSFLLLEEEKPRKDLKRRPLRPNKKRRGRKA